MIFAHNVKNIFKPKNMEKMKPVQILTDDSIRTLRKAIIALTHFKEYLGSDTLNGTIAELEEIIKDVNL
jgi:hypothetical protein